jgi:phenylalanyl-tRNA synthetase beta chain
VTACARVGAKLPEFEIKQAKVRGVASSGMLCSAKELGMTGGSDGIMELPADAQIGLDLRQLLDLDDQLYTIKLTPNRGDCLSLSGIAREVAALLEAPAAPVDCTPVEATAGRCAWRGIIADAAACPSYCGRVIRGTDPAAKTPRWMVQRLERCGLRAIHPVVDITNYVLLELGQPMHGFRPGPLARRGAGTHGARRRKAGVAE